MSGSTYKPGGDAQAISRIAHEHFGSFEDMFAYHGWPERGADMMRKVQTRVATTYGSVQAFEERYSDWQQPGSEPLYIRRRLRELRELIRNVDDPAADAGLYRKAGRFFLDIIDNLAAQRPEHHDIIRQQMLGLFAGPAQADRGAETSKIMVAKWKWPIVMKSPPSGKGGENEYGAEFSALRIFGYAVGKTKGWPVRKRHDFLTDFMEMELPDIVEKLFSDEYGQPFTTTRLRRMANVIASNASRFHRNDAQKYAVAISDWEIDLEFLKEKYYEGAGLKFEPWPITE